MKKVNSRMKIALSLLALTATLATGALARSGELAAEGATIQTHQASRSFDLDNKQIVAGTAHSGKNVTHNVYAGASQMEDATSLPKMLSGAMASFVRFIGTK